ncbi:hypothetical protein TUN199_04072 [Pyrenophora tritici-repentis]|nr:hypothetical protein Alg130_02058 [Pyrenophora tritici-repentis]KAI0611181.1 hypothetical protein TUN205_04581 [Pyrenophora tritici-repentis]KAI0623963.1 hypothetical protein TUN199_04072 [Pyrenophora tritici-repentis]
MSYSRSEESTSSGQSDSDVDNGDLKNNILLMLAESEAARAREQVQKLQHVQGRLTVEGGSLRARLDNAEARAQGATDSRDLIKKLKAMFAAERNEKEQAIKDKAQLSEALAAQLSAGAEAAKKSSEATAHLETTIENQRRQIENAEHKLTIVKGDRDWYRAEHGQMLEARNIQHTDRAPEINHLNNKITRLTQDVQNIKEDSRNKVQVLKRYIAVQVVNLDLFHNHIYTCRHHDVSNTYYDRIVRRVKKPHVAANEIFRDWKGDDVFMTEYSATRQALLDHHRAHEQAGKTRGEYSSCVKDILVHGDQHRGVSFDYTLD